MCLIAELLLIMSYGALASSNTIVSGCVGEDVILPCIIKYKEDFSYNKLFIRWKTEEFFVYRFSDGKFQEKHQNKIFQGRTQLFYKEFAKGNLSLLLKNIQTYDAGVYECLVFISEEIYTVKTELVVQDKAYGFTNESSVVKTSMIAFIVCVIMGCIGILRRRKRSRGRTGIPSGEKSENITQDRRPARRRKT